MSKKLLALLPLTLVTTGCMATGAATNGIMQRAAMAGVGIAADKAVTKATGATPAKDTSTQTIDVAAIPVTPASVPLRKTYGKPKAFETTNTILIGGYNVGAYTTASVSAFSAGGLSGGGGARAQLDYTVSGVTGEMIERVATAAQEDLVAQLQAAGYDVVSPAQIQGSPNATKLQLNTPPYDKNVEDGGKKALTVYGAQPLGTRKYMAPGVTSFNSNVPAKLSDEFDAVVVLPNLVFDFVQTGGSGRKNWVNRANVSGNVRFSVDTSSSVITAYSKNGRFTDMSYNLGLKEDAVVDGGFATVSEGETNKNYFEQGLGLALGVATAAKSSTAHGVQVNAEAWEKLALRAAKGYNAAIVANISGSAKS